MAGIGSAPGIILGVGVGAAAGAALEPAIEVPRQTAWQSAPNRVLDAALLASLTAQGAIDLSAAQAEAARTGYNADRLNALVYLAQTVPGFAEALALWRHGFIDDALFTHTLVKAGIDERYVAPILKLKTASIIGLGDVATAIVRGAVPAPAWVPVAPPTTTDNVPRFPVTNVDPVSLAAELGFNEDMLRIMTARSGLSLAPILATQALFRGVLTPNDWLLAIAEGDLRTEWADTLREAARAILSPHEYVEGELRGWITTAERSAGTAKHGMTQADSDLLYEISGRPVNVHEIVIGLARGGTYPSTYADVPDPYRKAIQESNIRPEWASIHYHARYSYPSAFVLRTLAQSGELGDAAAIEQRLIEIGWPPDLAASVAKAWATKATATNPEVKKALTKAYTEAQSSYIAEEATASDVQPIFDLLGVDATASAEILKAWDAIRALTRKQLSPAQIKKAVHEAVVNPATGVPWTQADGLAALLARGYDHADATTLLAE